MSPQMQIVFTALISAISSSGVMSLVIFLIQRRDRKKDEEKAKNSATSRMIIGLGHDKIVSLTDKYVRRGAITLKEKRNLQCLYEPYRDLGGNGDCKIGYDACEKLPVISDTDAFRRDVEIKRKEYMFDEDE